jgi:hypothetical protein
VTGLPAIVVCFLLPLVPLCSQSVGQNIVAFFHAASLCGLFFAVRRHNLKAHIFLSYCHVQRFGLRKYELNSHENSLLGLRIAVNEKPA